ncbi:MAG: STAS domain-containing protein [Actinomycetota bacterium]
MEGFTYRGAGVDVVAEEQGGDWVVRVAGELDLAGVPVLRDAVARLGRHPGRLVLDLSRLGFIDSTGVRLLVEIDEQAGGTVALLAPSHAVTRVLDLTGLADRFPRAGDLPEPALRADP